MIPKTCETCGKNFEVKAAREKTARFCSNVCRGLGYAQRYSAERSRKVEKTCEVCRAAFLVKPYRVETARFCSGSCRATWVGTLPHNRRPKPYMRGNKLRAGLRPTNSFRHGETSGTKNSKWTESIRLSCEHCGVVYERKPNEVRAQAGTRFCSRECFTASGCFRGKKSIVYVGGSTKIRGPRWREIRAEVVAEQRGDCAHCGTHVGPSLNVHHKRPFREFSSAAEANRRANLIGLCSTCHGLAERELERRRRRGDASPSRQTSDQ